MGATFKLAERTDLPHILTMMRDFYAHESLPFDEAVARRGVEDLLTNEQFGRFYLIQLDDAIAGYAVLTFGYSLEFHGRDAFIDELYVVAQYRGRGLGTHAITFLADACRQLGVQALHLEVDRGNVKAQSVYRQAGFHDHDRYLLTKWIS